jgi:hypothetical protein
LLTYRGENEPREAGDGEAARELGAMIVATSGGASAPEMAQAAAVMAGGPPPSSGLSQEDSAQWVVGCGKQGLRLGFDF